MLCRIMRNGIEISVADGCAGAEMRVLKLFNSIITNQQTNGETEPLIVCVMDRQTFRRTFGPSDPLIESLSQRLKRKNVENYRT